MGPRNILKSIFRSSEFGLFGVLLLLFVLLTLFGGTHVDNQTQRTVSNFLNTSTLLQLATEASFFAIMAVGMTAVIVSGGIDLSVGSIYALSGVLVGLAQAKFKFVGPLGTGLALGLGLLVGATSGFANGVLITRLKVHPFVITLGMMWILRGIAFVSSSAQSLNFPDGLRNLSQASLGLPADWHPVPLILTVLTACLGSFILVRTVAGRRIFAIGGNAQAAFLAGLPINRTLLLVYTLSGLTAGLSALLGASFYGAASCNDANGYELYVIASVVVGGVSLIGGKGSVWGAVLGALLIATIRQAIRTLHFDTNYEWILVGTAIIVAVVLDQASRKLSNRAFAK